METRAETAERVEKKVEKVKIEKFNPQEAQKFLSEWAYHEAGGYPNEGWVFTRTIEGQKWALTVNQKQKFVSLRPYEKPRNEDWLFVGVKRVVYNHQNRTLSFEHKNGRYQISVDGMAHFNESNDGKSYTYTALEQSQ